MLDETQTAALCIATATVIGCWLIFDWAREEPELKRAWRWGDKPRRPVSFEEIAATHLGGVAFFIGCCVVALQELGIG